MRLLVVGHPFIVGYNQKKYVAMKRLHPDLQLRIVGPKQIRHPFGAYPCEVHPKLNPHEVIPLWSVFSHSHMTYLLDPVGMAAILREFRPDIIHIEEEPHALVTVALVSLRAFFCPNAGLTLFTWDNLDRRRRFPLGRVKKRLRRYSLDRTTTVVCGNCDAEQLLRAHAGYLGPTAVLPQFGLDANEHVPGTESALREELGLEGSIVVGYAGRLVPEKGVGLLLSALARLVDYPWKLLLVGAGPLEQPIRQHWMSRLPGRIVHVRAVAHHEVPRYLRCVDIFVLASFAVPNWKEQFGLTLAQAMMLGLPSVVSSSGAIPEVAGPGGLVFTEGDEPSLGEALESLLRSPAWRADLGAQARVFALQRYALEAVAARYLEVFEQARRWHAARARERLVPAEKAKVCP